MSRWATAVIALVLAIAVGTSTLATCLAVPAGAPQAQMACCAHGHDQCPMHGSDGSAADCCQHESRRQQVLAAAERQPTYMLVVAFQQMAAATPCAGIPVPPDFLTSAHVFDRSTSPPIPRTAFSTVLLI